MKNDVKIKAIVNRPSKKVDTAEIIFKSPAPRPFIRNSIYSNITGRTAFIRKNISPGGPFV